MMAPPEPRYFRRPQHLYRICSHPTYHLHVGTHERRQVMWGLGYVLWFTADGVLEAVEAQVAGSLDVIGRAEGSSPIRVQRFWRPEAEAGVEDYGGDLKDFLDRPDSFDPAEAQEMASALVEWRSSGMFSLWWGAWFDVSAGGVVESS
jgi:hypothetical protein